MPRLDWSAAMDDDEYFAREDAAWQSPEHTDFFEAIAQWIPQGTRTLLDVGCGSGIGLQVWSRYVPSVSGVDASANCVRMAQQRNPEAYIWHMDARRLDIHADVVVSTAFLKHFPTAEWAWWLEKLTSLAGVRAMVGIQLADRERDDPGEYWHGYMPRAKVDKTIDALGWTTAGLVDQFEPTEPIFILERK